MLHFPPLEKVRMIYANTKHDHENLIYWLLNVFSIRKICSCEQKNSMFRILSPINQVAEFLFSRQFANWPSGKCWLYWRYVIGWRSWWWAIPENDHLNLNVWESLPYWQNRAGLRNWTYLDVLDLKKTWISVILKNMNKFSVSAQGPSYLLSVFS